LKASFTPKIAWLRFLPSFLVVGVAVAVAVLAPVYAARWARLPFLGVLLEPTFVVNEITAEDWPAMDAGARHPDHLLEVNGRAVTDIRTLNDLLGDNQYAPLFLKFERQADLSHLLITVTPRPVQFLEVLLLFIIPYLVGLAFLVVGLWTFRFDQSQTGRVFMVFAAAVSVTINALFDMRTTHQLALFWVLSLPVAGAALVHLALVFPEPVRPVARWPALAYLSWLLMLGFALPAAIEYVLPSSPWAYIPLWLNNYAFAGLAMLAFLAMLLARALRAASQGVRRQSRVIIFGASLAFLPILVLFFIPVMLGQQTEFRALVFLPPLLVFPLSVAYSIVRYRLLDVDRVLGDSLTYALTAGGAIALFYVTLTLLTIALGQNLAANDPLLVAVFLLMMVALLNPLRAFAQKTIDRIFYRSRADYRQVLTDLSRQMVVTPNIERMLRLLEDTMDKAFSPQRFVLFLYNDELGAYLPHSTRPHPSDRIGPESQFAHFINQCREAVWLPPGMPLPDDLKADESAIRRWDYQVFVPLRYEERLIGFFALGGRRSGQPYSSDDLEFLNAVAGQSSLTAENVRLFSNLERTLNETLEMKNLMDDIFASMPSGVITTDVKQKITLFNRAAERIFGVEVTQALGASVQEALAAFWASIRGIASATIEQDYSALGEEFTARRADGQELYLRLSSSPLKDARRKTMGATLLFDDLTAQRQVEKERERIRQTFGRVVAPRVRDKLLSDPSGLRLDGVRQEITVLFADMHSFTTFSEQTPPEELFGVLNSYLSLAAQAVLDEEGTLDKFMGDAVMAIWNAPDPQPDHTLRAVRAALEIERLIRAHRDRQPGHQQLYFGIGITRGEAMVGNIGANELFNYTAIGDTVNLAQRLESIAELGQILLSQPAYEAVKAQAEARPLEAVQLKGKTRPVPVFQLTGLKGA
jgi:PAS domain S-box-containing protein